MLLLGHAAVSARRGPRGTCQKTRAAPWAPAECGVTARSASDGVDANGMRAYHRCLQYRRYQCGMFRREAPRHAPGFPAFTALRSAWAEDLVVGNTCPGRCFAALPRKARRFGASGGCGCCSGLSPSLFRALREKRATLGWVGNVVVAATDPRDKLPSAYLRERLLVLH